MGTYSYSGNQNKQRDNHADEYLPDLLNDIQDEIEIVEQVLSGGEEGQVLTADSNGKAQWAEASGGGGFAFDGANMSVDENVVTFELTLNSEAISGSAFVYVYVTDYNGIPEYFNENWEGAIPTSTTGGFLGFVIYSGEQTEISLSDPNGGAGGDFYLNAIMPSGAIVTSPVIHFETLLG